MSGSSASLSFDIDSSQAQRAVSVLQALVQQSQATLQANTQLQSSTTNLTTAYGQNATELARLAEQTRNYGGTLGGLVTQLNALRTAVTSVSGGNMFAGYARMLNEAQAVAAQINTSVEGIDRFVSKARQLNITAQDLATGLNNITAALKSQTAEGLRANVVLTELGVRLNGINPNQPNLVLQQLADQLRRIQDPNLQLTAAQRVMGPGFAAQDVQALVRQPVIPFWQQFSQNRQADVQANIDRQQVGTQAMTIQTNRVRDEYNDLGSRFTQTGNLGRATFGISDIVANLFTPMRQELEELRRISKLPEAERRQYERVGERLNQAAERDPLVAAIRNVTSGTLLSNDAEIAARARQQRIDEGFFPAAATRIGRDLQNLVGAYQPITQSEREALKTPEERAEERRQASEALQRMGIPRARAIETAREQLAPSVQDPVREIYRRAFGDAEGQRQYGIGYENQIRSFEDLIRPQAPLQRETELQRYTQGLAIGDRGVARFGAEYYRTITGQQYLPRQGAATPPGAALADPNMSPEARQAGAVLRQEQQLGFRSQDIEDTQRVIQQNQELGEAISRGRGAAEDANRVFVTFFESLGKNRDVPRANAAALDALNVSMAQRVVQGQALVQQQREENAIAVQRATDASRLVGADPAARAAFMSATGVQAQIQREISGGQLPNPQGGMVPVRDANGNITHWEHQAAAPGSQAVVDERRRGLFVDQARQAADAATGLIGGITAQNQIGQRQAGLMGQGYTAQQAGARAEVEAKLAAEAGRAQKAMEETANATDKAGQDAHKQAEEMLRVIQAEQARTEETLKQRDAIQSILQAMAEVRSITEDTARTMASMGVSDAFRQAAGELQKIIDGILKGAGVGTPGAAVPSGLSKEQFLDAVAKRESGNQNITQKSGGPASGYWQMEDKSRPEFVKMGSSGTWEQAAAGAHLPQRPGGGYGRAMDYSREEQYAAASWLYDQRGEQPWAMSAGRGGGGAPGVSPATTASLPDYDATIKRLIETGEKLPYKYWGLENGTIDQINAAVAAVRAKRGTDIAARTQEVGEAVARELKAQGARIAIYQGGGGPGAAARIITRQPGMTDAEWAERQRFEEQRVVGGQQVGAAARVGEEERTIQQQREALKTYTGTLAEQAAKARESAAATAALNAAWQNPAIDVASEKVRQFVLELGKETEATMKSVQAQQAAIEKAGAMAAASSGGQLAVDKANALFDIQTKINGLLLNRANTTDAREIEAINNEIAANQKLIDTYDERILREQRIRAGLQAHQMGLQDQIQVGQNALGPFATALDQDRARRYMQLAQQFTETPGLEQSKQGQDLLKANQQRDAINEQTQAMNEYRESAHAAASAVEQAFMSVVDRSATAGQAIHNLANALQKIAMETFVIKPFEKLMDKAFQSIFGDTPAPGSAGDTTGKTGESVYGAAGRLMNAAPVGGGLAKTVLSTAGGIISSATSNDNAATGGVPVVKMDPATGKPVTPVGATDAQGNNIVGGNTTGGTSTGGGDVNTGGGDVVNVGGAVNVAVNAATGGGGMANCCCGGSGGLLGGATGGGGGGGANAGPGLLGRIGNWIGDLFSTSTDGGKKNVAGGTTASGAGATGPDFFDRVGNWFGGLFGSNDNATPGSTADIGNAIAAQTGLVTGANDNNAGGFTTNASSGLLSFGDVVNNDTGLSLGGGPRIGSSSDVSGTDYVPLWQQSEIAGARAASAGLATFGTSGATGGDGGGLLGQAFQDVGKAVTSGGGGGGGGGSSGGGGGGSSSSDSSGPGLLGRIFGHAGGLGGWATDKILGEGMYKRGGLIGMLSRDVFGSGDKAGGGKGGTGGGGGGTAGAGSGANAGKTVSVSGPNRAGNGTVTTATTYTKEGATTTRTETLNDGSVTKTVTGTDGKTSTTTTAGPGQSAADQATGADTFSTTAEAAPGADTGAGISGIAGDPGLPPGVSGWLDTGRWDTTGGGGGAGVGGLAAADQTSSDISAGALGFGGDFGGAGLFDSFGGGEGDFGGGSQGSFGGGGDFADAGGGAGDFGGGLDNTFGSLDGGGLYAMGGVPELERFARGGSTRRRRGGMARRFAYGGTGGAGLASLRNTVVEAPTVFRFAGGGAMGMAGEGGSEAILPLRRDGSGRLGVSAGNFGGGGDTYHNHTWHVNTPDAQSFKSSRNQIESHMNKTITNSRNRNIP